eukprot:TRINITY_DN3874_c0_g1_i1.p1 TRINITY_DN3874_c0_g1~~TRINITY_DN3874_c0_g1_i1.p1  ORF type:complete len:543 (+),score=104.22 TRINITY_DN3874_c0_g1_i1:58-1686(+)
MTSPAPQPDTSKDTPPLSQAYEDWLVKVFNELDENHDGNLSESELQTGLERRHIPTHIVTHDGAHKRILHREKHHDKHEHVEVSVAHELMDDLDLDHDGTVTFQEFRKYMSEQEAHLQRIFKTIDTNGDGKLDSEEIITAMEKLYGVSITPQAAHGMINRIDKDGDGRVSLHEWRDFMFLLPLHCTAGMGGKQSQQQASVMLHIFDYWSASACVDFGDLPICIPTSTTTASGYQQALVTFEAGALAGVVSRTFTAPLDRIKTLMQLRTSMQPASISSVVKTIYLEGGWKAFWRSNGTNCIKIIPESSTRFVAFEYYKRLIHSNFSKGPSLMLWERFAAGALAGATAQALIFPLDYVKTQLSASPGRVTVAEIVRNTWNGGGPRAFYRGLTPALVGIIPYAGIDLAIYETLKSVYTKYLVDKALKENNTRRKQFCGAVGSIVAPLVCGTISSSIGQFVSYPLNLVRTRMQAQGVQLAIPTTSKSANTSLSRPYTGMVDVFRQTIQSEGIRGLYKGIGPNFLKVVPAVGVSYVVYENTKQLLSA